MGPYFREFQPRFGFGSASKTDDGSANPTGTYLLSIVSKLVVIRLNSGNLRYSSHPISLVNAWPRIAGKELLSSLSPSFALLRYWLLTFEATLRAESGSCKTSPHIIYLPRPWPLPANEARHVVQPSGSTTCRTISLVMNRIPCGHAGRIGSDSA
jgi:hypothetical protein